MSRILIIGAGVAGIAAAEYCKQHNHEPTLVEEAARPGGRCRTLYPVAPQPNIWADFGAQYFTARHPAFQDFVATQQQAGRLIDWTPQIVTAEQIGPTWLVTPSPDTQKRYTGAGGMACWIDRWSRAAALTIHTQCQITRIIPANQHWQVEYSDGSLSHHEQIICTPPARRTAELLGERASAIGVLNKIGQALLPCHSLIVEAPALADRQALFFQADCLAWAADNGHKAGRTDERSLWTLHTRADFSQAHAQSALSPIAERMIEDFARATAQPRNQIKVIHGHYWHDAYPGPGASDNQRHCWADPAAGLAIAGDWLAGGRIEGAWLSGRAAACQLLGRPMPPP